MKKILPIFIAIIIVVGVGAFYGGIKYGESKNEKSGNFPNFGNLSASERQQRFGQMSPNGVRQGNGSFTSGEIISKDEKSLTIKLPDGGSKIIFFSDLTEITKSAKGTGEDFVVGENVIASGEINQDGSITAKTIQLRPAMPTAPAPISGENNQASQ